MLGRDQPGVEPGVGRERLERRPGRVLALEGPVVQRVVVGRVVEERPLALADAVDEVGRARSSGTTPSRARRRCAGRARPSSPPRRRWARRSRAHGRWLAWSRPLCSACSATACTSMSMLRTRSSPGTGGSLVDHAHRVAVGVDLDAAQAGRAAQVGLVRPSRRRTSRSRRSACTASPPASSSGAASSSSLRDLARVADDVGGEPPVRVAAHRHAVGRHRRAARPACSSIQILRSSGTSPATDRHVGAEPLVGDALLELLDRAGDARAGQARRPPWRAPSSRSSSSSSPSTERSIVTCTEMRLSTMTLPLRSRMRPRGASTATTRIRLASAATWNSSAAMTCRYQRRRTARRTARRRRCRGRTAAGGASRRSPVHRAGADAVLRARGPPHRPDHRARRRSALSRATTMATFGHADAEELDADHGPEHDVQDDTQQRSPAAAVATGIHQAARSTLSCSEPTRKATSAYVSADRPNGRLEQQVVGEPAGEADGRAPVGPGRQAGGDGDEEHAGRPARRAPRSSGAIADLEGEGDDEHERDPGGHHAAGPIGVTRSPSHRSTVHEGQPLGVDEGLDDQVEGEARRRPPRCRRTVPDRDRRRERAVVGAAGGRARRRLELGRRPSRPVSTTRGSPSPGAPGRAGDAVGRRGARRRRSRGR